jgi:hypothetical protein
MDGHAPPPVVINLNDLPPDDDIPEESEDMNASDDPGSAFAPPARIAARFYRNNLNRRKSSATSSRRNSLSSTHSHQSNNSYRAACRSNHVAQYLRRASILEGRKARLAAREAHAEQVRLRAALAKSAPRGSNSEERALAAQQAREKHLAQVAATCAEEVRRAKRVAEEMKGRRAAEEERYRMEMEEKLADAEKRRLEYKRNNIRRSRTASTLLNVETKKPIVKATSHFEEEAAVRCLQRAWRTHRRKKTMDGFTELGLSIDKVHDTTFEDIQALLCDDLVVKITRRVLDLFNLPTVDDNTEETQTVARTFLTAYLILGHPAQILTQDGEQEQDLMKKAKDLIINFEAALAKTSTENRYAPPATLLEVLHIAHSAYVTTFAAWKAKDKSALIEILVQSFASLDAIWQNVKDDRDGEVAEDYGRVVREGQVELMVKLRRLAGPERANFLIRKAIRESRRGSHVNRRKPVGDVRPRGADANAIHPSPIDGSEPVIVAEQTARLISNTPSSDEFQTKSISRMFSVMPPNRVISHELAIDKEYRVDLTPHTAWRDSMHRQVCDDMSAAFERGEGDSWTMATAENIRSKLLQLLNGSRPEGAMHRLIAETLDPDLIRRQCAQGIFSYQNFFNFMSTVLPKLCAPVRDEEVKAVAESLQQYGSKDEMIDKLFSLFHIIDVMALDFSNFLLTNVGPRLVKEAPAYEHRSFAKDLEQGVVTLQRTQHWWNNASVNVLTEADHLDPNHRPTSRKIYARGLVDLAIATSPLKEADVPETLSLDTSRIARIREESVRITVIGSIVLGAKNLLKRDVRSQWKAETNRMWDALKSGYEDEAIPGKLLSILESSHVLPPATKTQLQATVARLLSQATAGKFTDPVARVLFTRLKTHIFHRISADSSNERVRVVSTASESLATAGLPEFGAMVGAIVDLLSKISDVDRKSHGPWYERIATEAEKSKESGGESGVAEHGAQQTITAVAEGSTS